MSSGLFDVGLQPERTLLAWQRTCLALAVGIVVGSRLALPALGPLSAVFAIAGLALVGAAWLGATRRYRRANRDLTGPAAVLAQGGLPIAAAAAAAMLFAAGGAVFVLFVGWPLH